MLYAYSIVFLICGVVDGNGWTAAGLRGCGGSYGGGGGGGGVERIGDRTHGSEVTADMILQNCINWTVPNERINSYLEALKI
jgi:hypothetical protein